MYSDHGRDKEEGPRDVQANLTNMKQEVDRTQKIKKHTKKRLQQDAGDNERDADGRKMRTDKTVSLTFLDVVEDCNEDRKLTDETSCPTHEYLIYIDNAETHCTDSHNEGTNIFNEIADTDSLITEDKEVNPKFKGHGISCFQSDVSSLDFTRSSSLQNHSRPPHTRPSQTTPAQLDACSLDFTGSGSLQNHSRPPHTRPSHTRPAQSDACSLDSPDTSSLQNSTRPPHTKPTHTRPAQSNVSSVDSTDTSSLQSHSRPPHTSPPHTILPQSDACSVDSTGTSSLQNSRRPPHTKPTHTRTPKTNKKSYKCDKCGAGFTKNSNLKIHNRIHTGERPYECKDCGDRFFQSGHLTAHKKIHTGRNRTDVIIVVLCLSTSEVFVHMQEFTQERNRTSAIFVVKRLDKV